MQQVLIVLGVLVAVGLVIGLGILGAKKERERREALGAMAAKLGWSFHADRVPGLDSEFPQFTCFSQGHSRAALNTMRGPLVIDGKTYAAVAGDYTYKVTTSNGKTTTTTTYNFSYLILGAPFPGVPDLFIRRENFFDKIAGAIGFDDIDFESAEFSRKFFVKSSDRKFAYAVIHPRMMEFLLAGDPPPIDIRAGKVCFRGNGSRWSPAQFGLHLEFASKFFDLWPDYLQDDLTGASRGS